MKIVILRKKIKSFIIKVVDANTVSVSVPFDMDDKMIENLLAQKQRWINKKIKEKQGVFNKNKDIFEYKKVLIKGAEYDVTYLDLPNVCCVDNFLILPQNKVENIENAKKIIENYLKQLAKNILPKCVAFWGEKLSLCPTSIQIKYLKSKWGSCNGDGEIVLNVRLIQLPSRLMEYVIVHELCHLKNLNHSENFWQSVQKVFENYQDLRKELRDFEYLILT